jgi:hypothetical protein
LSTASFEPRPCCTTRREKKEARRSKFSARSRLCYTQIVPVDEAVTLTLFHREDEPLVRLMLSDDEKSALDRHWNELHFVSQDALTIVDAFAQLMEYATQDNDPRLFEPFRKPINERAAAYRQQLLDCESEQIDSLIEFASKAYRRPITRDEEAELRKSRIRSRTGSRLRHRACEPPELLSLVVASRRGTDGSRGGRPSPRAGRSRRAGAADDERRENAQARDRVRLPVAAHLRVQRA